MVKSILTTLTLVIVLTGTYRLPAARAAQAVSPDKTAITTEAIALDTVGGKLHGTIELPKTHPPYPVALIIAGSGPTDRNGNSPLLRGENNSLKMLAEGLAAQGIASLRYDKRGVAASVGGAKREDELRFETYIDDAVLWGKRLQSDKRFSSLAIIGHSEGSLIGMVATQKLNADAFVSIAGAGRAAQVVIVEQLKAGLPPDLVQQAEAILKELGEGRTVKEVPPALAGIFRASVQPYIISWFKYDPAKEIARVSAPVLIVQGTTDIQAKIEDAKSLHKSNPSAKLALIEGMNHILKQVPIDRETQIKSYSDPSLAVMPALINEISAFVKAAKKKAAPAR